MTPSIPALISGTVKKMDFSLVIKLCQMVQLNIRKGDDLNMLNDSHESFKTECSLPGRRRGKRQVAADLQEGKHPYYKLSMETMRKVTREEHLGAESQQ